MFDASFLSVQSFSLSQIYWLALVYFPGSLLYIEMSQAWDTKCMPRKSLNSVKCCLANYMFAECLASVIGLQPQKMLNEVIFYLLWTNIGGENGGVKWKISYTFQCFMEDKLMEWCSEQNVISRSLNEVKSPLHTNWCVFIQNSNNRG